MCAYAKQGYAFGHVGLYVYLYNYIYICVTGFGKTDLMGIIVDSSYESKYTCTLDRHTMVFQIITLRKNTGYVTEREPSRLLCCRELVARM